MELNVKKPPNENLLKLDGETHQMDFLLHLTIWQAIILSVN